MLRGFRPYWLTSPRMLNAFMEENWKTSIYEAHRALVRSRQTRTASESICEQHKTGNGENRLQCERTVSLLVRSASDSSFWAVLAAPPKPLRQKTPFFFTFFSVFQEKPASVAWIDSAFLPPKSFASGWFGGRFEKDNSQVTSSTSVSIFTLDMRAG